MSVIHPTSNVPPNNILSLPITSRYQGYQVSINPANLAGVEKSVVGRPLGGRSSVPEYPPKGNMQNPPLNNSTDTSSYASKGLPPEDGRPSSPRVEWLGNSMGIGCCLPCETPHFNTRFRISPDFGDRGNVASFLMRRTVPLWAGDDSLHVGYDDELYSPHLPILNGGEQFVNPDPNAPGGYQEPQFPMFNDGPIPLTMGEHEFTCLPCGIYSFQFAAVSNNGLVSDWTPSTTKDRSKQGVGWYYVGDVGKHFVGNSHYSTDKWTWKCEEEVGPCNIQEGYNQGYQASKGTRTVYISDGSLPPYYKWLKDGNSNFRDRIQVLNPKRGELDFGSLPSERGWTGRVFEEVWSNYEGPCKDLLGTCDPPYPFLDFNYGSNTDNDKGYLPAGWYRMGGVECDPPRCVYHAGGSFYHFCNLLSGPYATETECQNAT